MSNDGKRWNAFSMNTVFERASLTYGYGIFLIVGDHGKITGTDNGNSWIDFSNRIFGISNANKASLNLNSVTRGPDYVFVAVGDMGNILFANADVPAVKPSKKAIHTNSIRFRTSNKYVSIQIPDDLFSKECKIDLFSINVKRYLPLLPTENLLKYRQIQLNPACIS